MCYTRCGPTLPANGGQQPQGSCQELVLSAAVASADVLMYHSLEPCCCQPGAGKHSIALPTVSLLTPEQRVAAWATPACPRKATRMHFV